MSLLPRWKQAVAGAMAVVAAAGATAPAAAQKNDEVADRASKEVTLRIWKKDALEFKLAVDGIADALERAGCPAKVVESSIPNQGLPRSVNVEIGDYQNRVIDLGSAHAIAEAECTEPP